MAERFRIPWTTGKFEMSQPESTIAPPPALVQQWINEEDGLTAGHIATRAAQWGADQELEACCALLELSDDNARDFLYSARRPEPPSLKEQALEALKSLQQRTTDPNIIEPLRRALEQLDD